jgi:hypothetical protein
VGVIVAVTVVRKGRKYAGEYVVYTREEADEKRLKYVYWKDAYQQGQWVLTDDGMVCRLLGYKRYNETRHTTKRKHAFMVFPMCRLWATRPAKFNALEFMDKDATWRTHPDQTVSKLERGKQRAKAFVEVYVSMLLTGKVDWQRLGYLWAPKSKKPEYWARKVAKEEWIREMVREEIIKVFQSNNVSEGTVIQLLTKAAEVAENNGDAANIIKAAIELAKMLDMYPDKKTGGAVDAEWDYVDVDSAVQTISGGDTAPAGTLPPVEIPEVLNEEEFGSVVKEGG